MPRTVRALAIAMPLVLLVSSTGVVAPASAVDDTGEAAVPTYVQEADVGVEHRYEGSWQYFTGGGVAVLDCDADALPDLYFAGGAEPAGLYRNTSVPGGPLRFEQLPAASTDLVDVTGAYPLDIDGDGLDDLAVMRRGENVLLRGLGDCRFERANEAWGFDGADEWSTAFSAKWQPGDGWPTLAVGDYLTIVEAGATPECDDNAIYRPAADGYAAPEAIVGHCTLSMLFSDWDRSGDQDLRVTNDRQYYRPGEGEDQLWEVPADAPAREYTRDDGWQQMNVFGMGIASQDTTGDGYPEYFISTMAGNRLRQLADGPSHPTYMDTAYARGVDVPQPYAGEDEDMPSTAWHAEFDDVNNDGLFDLYVAKGNVEQMPDHAAADPNDLLIAQPDGTWREGAPAAGIVRFDRTRGAAVVDLNLDGLLDLVEVEREEPARIWRNAGSGTAESPAPMGHWLEVELAQDGPNRDAIGAWIELRAGDISNTREVTVGGGHVSGQLGPVHFGLGPAEDPQVRVLWPDGEVGEWMAVQPDQRVRIERDSKAPVALGAATVLTGAPGLQEEGPLVPELPAVEPIDPATCVRTADTDKSVARLWDEVLLDAIRRDFPAPTVHSRNLYHVSAAMWDAWAVYDPVADGVFVDQKITLEDPTEARDEAISFAAYRVLSHRYEHSVGGAESLHEFDLLMAALCYPSDLTSTEGDAPAALGNRIAKHIIDATIDDGSLEATGYAGPYRSVNDPMIVEKPGTVMNDPNRWQPLALRVSFTQNGQLQPVGPQKFVGPHWGNVTAFALPEASVPGLPIDPGDPPFLHDPETDAQFKADAEQVAMLSGTLDPRDGVMVDISPNTFGNAPLGTNDWAGYEFNPYTSLPYQPVVVPRGDYGRAIAEFWADGPHSETPPGHWNTLANAVTDYPGFERRIGGEGPEVDPLEWDVKMYLALNGAVHDAAIAAWGAKGYYDYVRPISMIRWMGGLGQSSDPALPSYDPDGLPLIDGQVELITEASSARGERHEHLADHVGEIAIRAWSGNPEDAETELGGVDWIRAVEWVPYQLSTFVTPAFAGYVSGHSTFSRAAAEVLAAMTGTPYFPGGLGTWTVPAGSLHFELGPSVDVPLQWATYYDASDQAGISRLYGGIHVRSDDLRGRIMGSQCGIDAWQTAQRYWDGTARDA